MFRKSAKIKTVRELCAIKKKLMNESKKLVQCDGVFDLIHFGHIEHFDFAKKQGDIVYVVVVGDKFVRKGPHRPLFNEEIRAKWLAGLADVDYIIVNQAEGPYEIIKQVQPDVLVKGEGYQTKPTEGFLRDKALVESYGGRVAFAPEPIHSTEIITKMYSFFS